MMKSYNSRSGLKYQLAWQWVVRNRPDVADAISHELDKLIPGKRTRAVLPASLERLKA